MNTNHVYRNHESDNYVWDTGLLMWVPMEQPLINTGSLTVDADVTDRAGRLLGHVTVDNFPASQVVEATDLDIRDLAFATDAVDVSGSSVSVDALPDDATTTGTITTNGDMVTLALGSSKSSIAIQLTGVWTGQVVFEATVDGVNWETHEVTSDVVVGGITNAVSGNGIFESSIGALHSFRVRSNAAMTGTLTVTMRASIGTHAVELDSAIPAGTNQIGHVVTDVGSVVEETWGVIDPSGGTGWNSSTASSSAVTVACAGYSTVVFQLIGSGVLSGGNIQVRGSLDNGSTYQLYPATLWVSSSIRNLQPSVTAIALSTVLTGGVTGRLFISVSGLTHIQIFLVVAISGAGTLTIRSTASAAPLGEGAITLSGLHGPFSIGGVNTGNAQVNVTGGSPTGLCVGVVDSAGNLSAVKAASTLPLATDPALVVTQRDALPAGTNVIGHVIVDSGAGTQYTEDTASVGGESVTLAGAIRADQLTTDTDADGNYSRLKTDAVGRLRVSAETGKIIDGAFYADPALAPKLDELILLNRQVVAAMLHLLNVADTRSNYRQTDLTLN